jgi:serine/threonine-protein phosphatase 6 regulatory ankyrin repeat subunit B
MKKILATIILSAVLLLSRLAAGQAAPGSVDEKLIIAAQGRDTAAAQQLLDKGANIEARDSSSNTALINAAAFGTADMVKFLLDKGANVEAKGNGGNTALITAVFYGKTDAVKLLLDKGANIEAKNNYGLTALLEAATGGKTDVAKLLLDKGANVEVKDNNSNTALISAAEQGHADVVKLLLDKGANVEVKDNNSNTALSNAAFFGKADVVKLLLDKGANIEAKGSNGWTPLMETGNAEVMKLLLDKGANIEARDNYGATALIRVAQSGNTEIVRVLLDKGANIEAVCTVLSCQGNTALITAAYYDQTDVAKLLLEKGANMEAKDTRLETALIVAAQNGRVNTVKLLLEKGANIEAKDYSGNTALKWAVIEHKAEVAHLLEQALSQDPRSKLAEYSNELQRYPWEDATREKAIQLAISLPSLPAIPDDARQLFQQASALIKTSNPRELGQPIELLREALAIAPWWGNAYYNLSRALELSGQYDEAVKQLNYYLELKPSEADAADARAKIAVIQAEKQAAAQKTQANESVLAVKYVSGGATRLRQTDAPAWWHELNRIDTIYTYQVPEENPFYLNAFRMPNGQMVAITLVAQSSNGTYAGDKIGIFALPATNSACLEGGNPSYAFGAQEHTSVCGTQYDVSVTNPPNATVTVTYTATGASVTLPVTLLYRGRALKGAWTSGTVYQGGAAVMVLKFDMSMVYAAQDPNVNAMGLTPTSVAPYQNNQ